MWRRYAQGVYVEESSFCPKAIEGPAWDRGGSDGEDRCATRGVEGTLRGMDQFADEHKHIPVRGPPQSNPRRTRLRQCRLGFQEFCCSRLVRRGEVEGHGGLLLFLEEVDYVFMSHSVNEICSTT